MSSTIATTVDKVNKLYVNHLVGINVKKSELCIVYISYLIPMLYMVHKSFHRFSEITARIGEYTANLDSELNTQMIRRQQNYNNRVYTKTEISNLMTKILNYDYKETNKPIEKLREELEYLKNSLVKFDLEKELIYENIEKLQKAISENHTLEIDLMEVIFNCDSYNNKTNWI